MYILVISMPPGSMPLSFFFGTFSNISSSSSSSFFLSYFLGDKKSTGRSTTVSFVFGLK